jgi:NADPH:quinone reductase-like Zn-dependent oxidoreductase
MSRIILAPLLSPFVRQRLVALMSNESTATLDRLRGLAESGSVRAHIGRVWPLEQGAEAVGALTGRRINGRIVVAVAP